MRCKAVFQKQKVISRGDKITISPASRLTSAVPYLGLSVLCIHAAANHWVVVLTGKYWSRSSIASRLNWREKRLSHEDQLACPPHAFPQHEAKTRPHKISYMDHNYHPLELEEQQWTKKNIAKQSIFSLAFLFDSARRLILLLGRSIILNPKSDQLKPTSWLDGLRGFAALLVYFHHHQIWAHLSAERAKWFENSFGYEGEYYFAALPFIRTFFSGGHFAVATFFVLSGYVLSLKPLSLVHSSSTEPLLHSLSSSLFRRWLRLFLPTLLTTLLWLTTWHAFGWWCSPFKPEPTYLAELFKYFRETTQYAFLYKGPKGFPWLYWNLHTWTIPYEFKGSLAIYTIIPALALSTPRARFSLTALLAIYFLYLVDGWYLTMFLSGMLLCDLDLLLLSQPPSISLPPALRTPTLTLLLVLSLYLGGVPLAQNSLSDFQSSPGWRTLSHLTPPTLNDHKWFFLAWAAPLLLFTVPRLPWLKACFTSRFCQYLGRISFSLYLMHGPVIWTLGNAMYLLVGWGKDEEAYAYPWYYNRLPVSRAGPLGLEPAFWIPQIVLLPGTLVVANLVTVAVDEPCVRFAAWARARTLRRE